MQVDEPGSSSDSPSREQQETPPRDDAMQVDAISNPTGKDKAKELGYPDAEDGYHWTLQKNGKLRYDRNNRELPKRVYDETTGKFVDADHNKRPSKESNSGYESDTEETMPKQEQKKQKKDSSHQPTNYQERRADAGVGNKVDFLTHPQFRTERRLRRVGNFKQRNIYVVSYQLSNGKRVRIAAVSQPAGQLPKGHEDIDESTLASLTKTGHSEAVHNRIETNYPEAIPLDTATRRYEATTREQCGSGKGGASCRHLYPSKAEAHYYGYPYSAAEDHITDQVLLKKVLDNLKDGKGPTFKLNDSEKEEYKKAEKSAIWERQNAEEQNLKLGSDLENQGKKDSDDEYSSDKDPILIPPAIRRGIGDITQLGKARLIDIPAEKTLSPEDMKKQKEWVKTQAEKQRQAKKQKINQ